MSRKLFLVTALLLVSIVVVACGAQAPADANRDGAATDYASLVGKFRAAGATIESEDEVSQPFFSVTGKTVKVNGEAIQVFEYADAEAAKVEAALVSPGGTSAGTTMINWVSDPHFYRAGRMIVLYIGNEASIVTLLEGALGPQFAGA